MTPKEIVMKLVEETKLNEYPFTWLELRSGDICIARCNAEMGRFTGNANLSFPFIFSERYQTPNNPDDLINHEVKNEEQFKDIIDNLGIRKVSIFIKNQGEIK